MLIVKKLNEDIWVAMEEKKVEEKKVEEKKVEEKEELGLPDDLGMSQEEWDRLEEKLENDAISWWV